MLNHSAAGSLLTLLPTEVKMVGAMAVHATTGVEPALNDIPFLGFPRFLVEHLLRNHARAAGPRTRHAYARSAE